MGLLSLFSSRKGNAPAPERGRRSRSDPGAGIASSRRLAEEYADDTLDPEFPQKQRARRRLIGAVVLMAAAVIVLPIVFETQPRPVVDNIAVKIDGGPGGAAGKVKPDARKADPLPPAPQSKLDSQALDAGEELVADSAAAKPSAAPTVAATAAAPADKIADKPATPAAKPGSGKFLVLIGAFSSEEKAKLWLSKLKAGKVPAYIEKKVLADGERVLLRAGPFSDRDAADAAEKRVRAAGLTAKVIEQ
ncbi:SPOR domain-containing protein [Cupriavidus basilensis]|uniref:SPOR domain-containing protein n=1 Tax=Cupriavidus basilensis TaxID=68895 RepID=UPI0020A61D29|nr:SPOR domain-containing protein [Cupriavidus basilensis]MCP3020986.1 SPOR domain-containing protein [Cupriavidus basilensis]MDR3382893.1 SPOR domain-containing protein [Cupriavidus basilensis]